MRSQSDCVCLFVRVTLVVFRRVFGLYENHAHRISMCGESHTSVTSQVEVRECARDLFRALLGDSSPSRLSLIYATGRKACFLLS